MGVRALHAAGAGLLGTSNYNFFFLVDQHGPGCGDKGESLD